MSAALFEAARRDGRDKPGHDGKSRSIVVESVPIL
jgi:hypothetical protein